MKKMVSVDVEDAEWLKKNSISLSQYIRNKIKEDRSKQTISIISKRTTETQLSKEEMDLLNNNTLPELKKCLKGHPDFSALMAMCPNCANEAVKLTKKASEGI